MRNNQIFIYGHTGCNNHGNEAIVRGIVDLMGDIDINVITSDIESDRKFNLEEICKLIPLKREIGRYSFINILGFIAKEFHLKDISLANRHKSIFSLIKKGDIFLFEAGDQCFENKKIIENYHNFNLELLKHGARLFFLMGSFPATKVNELSFFLNDYEHIILRESISFNALKNYGYNNISYSPCPAFKLIPAKLEKNTFFEIPCIGLTIGWLAQNKSEFNELLFKRVIDLVKYIINNTNYNIALIPHVNSFQALTDVSFLKKVKEEFYDENRIVLFQENSAQIQKKLISRCLALVTVRTHASIAAYSSFVPALVIGYSQKSKGISKDIFGKERLLLPIENLRNEDALRNAFNELVTESFELKVYLKSRMPEYLKPLEEIKKIYERNYK